LQERNAGSTGNAAALALMNLANFLRVGPASEESIMEVRSWMTRDVRTVSPLDSVARAKQLLEEYRINQLPVVVEGKLVGILTDRDVRDALASAAELSGPARQGVDPRHMTVETVMTPHVLTVLPEDSIVYAARLLRRERIGALPVVEGSRLVGIITRSDLLEALVELAALRSDSSNVAPRARFDEPFAGTDQHP
jgi:acetoin utilization protein AcuB